MNKNLLFVRGLLCPLFAFTAFVANAAMNFTAVSQNASRGIVSPQDGKLTSGTQVITAEPKIGYVLESWVVTTNPLGQQVVDGPMNQSTLTLKYNPKVSYVQVLGSFAVGVNTIKFDPGSGVLDGVDSLVVTNFTNYGSYNIPRATWGRNTFEGWYIGEKKIELSDTVLLSGAATLKAKWSILPTHTVYFDAGVGSCEEDERVVYEGDEIGTLPTALRDGYNLQGWYTDPVSGVRISEKTRISAEDEGMTYYAHWTPKSYSIKSRAENCVLNFGSSPRFNTPLTITCTLDTLPGYDVAFEDVTIYPNEDESAQPLAVYTSGTRWSFTMEDFYFESVLVVGSTTKTARQYVVTLDAAGGSVVPSSVTLTFDQPYGALPKPEKPGYEFVQWLSEAGEQISDETLMTTPYNHRVKAEWTPKTYQLTFDGNGATVLPAVRPIVYGSKYGELPKPTREGYAFSGWYLEGDRPQQISEVSTFDRTSDTTLTAHWTANKYAVKFSANGGRGTMVELKDRVYDQDFALPKNEFTRLACSFLGWSTNKTDTVALWSDMATVRNLAPSGEVVLFAIWHDDRNELTKAAHGVNVILESTGANAFVATEEGAKSVVGPIGKMSLTIDGEGTLTFNWKTTDATSYEMYLNTLMYTTCGKQDGTSGHPYHDISCVTGEDIGNGWTKVTIVFTTNDTHTLEWWSYSVVESDYLLIDQVRWSPLGDHPEPEEVDAPTITSIIVTDNEVILTSTSDARFAYQVIASDSMESPNWIAIGEVIIGTDDGISFVIPRAPAQKQRFYKVRVIARQD